MKVVELAACGDLDGVKAALASKETTKENVNSLDKDGRSAYHYSCLNDDVRLMEVLLNDERIDVDQRTPKGDSGVHLAALYSSLRSLERLLKDPRGAKLINAKNNFKETPLHLCAGSGDKGASKTAKMLLSAGASLLEKDQWGRGPRDVSVDNAENPLTVVFKEYLEGQSPELREKVEALSKEYQDSQKEKPVVNSNLRSQKANMLAAGLGGALKRLKKVDKKDQKVKHMFTAAEGKVTDKPKGKDLRFARKVLSKLVDFPGDVEEIRKYLADPNIDAGGKDAYGLTALHKFASWNKVELLEMLVPKLNEAELNAQDPDGKTALHWACEMASVAAVTFLVNIPEVNRKVKDKKGRTPNDILDGGDGGAVVERVRKALNGGGQ